MTASEDTYRQIERALRKAASKFSPEAECPPLTDLLIQANPETGDLMIYDDDDHELTRCVVEEWIGASSNENFYDDIQPILKEAIARIKDVTDHVAILKPYSYVLIGEDHETIADLHLVDDEQIVLNQDLMEGLGADLDAFWEKLSKED